MKKIFGGLDITWKRLIIFAILIGIYTGIVAMVPQFRDTSIADISIYFEWWIFFGIIIIVNSKSPKESALKCFIFFLISQPLVYLVQVYNNPLGWGIFRYYPGWFRWTLLTIPMGFIGYYMKKDDWIGLLILGPMYFLLFYLLMGYISEAYSFFPNHLLSALFCAFQLIIYPLFIFKKKEVKITGVVIASILICIALFLGFRKKSMYSTTILLSGSENSIVFDDTYKVSLEDERFGEVFIVYEENIEDYMVNANFMKTGKTVFIIESPDGEKYEFDLEVGRNTYEINKK